MEKKLSIFLLIVLTFLATAINCFAAGGTSDQIVVIGQNGVYDLTGAVNALNQNAGNAVIYLTAPLTMRQQVELPANLSGLKSVTLASYNGSPVTVSMNGSVICANGIPFTLDNNITLSNGFLAGGGCIAQPGTVSYDNSELVINGSADYVIGGGLAMGSGTVSSVKDVNIIINGSSSIVHGGGYAYNGGIADVSGSVNIVLPRTGTVVNTVYGGGYASGSGSSAPVRSAHVIALGKAGSVIENNGLSENGGNAAVGTYNIEILNPTTPKNPVYPVYQPTPAPQYNTTVMYIGPGQQAANFNDAVNLLPGNAGLVEFRLMGDFYQANNVIIPSNRNIISLTITGNNNTLKTVTWDENGTFFANGIPTTITSSVRFKEGIIYGGAEVTAGQRSTLQSTYLEIAGRVSRVIAGSKATGNGADAHVANSTLIFSGRAESWLHGGGGALYGGRSVVDELATLVIMQGAVIDYSISAGGYAFGAGAQSIVQNAYMDVSGNITYAVFLGGYADQKSSSIIKGLSHLFLEPGGNVGQSVWYGGRAFNQSDVSVDTVSAEIQGHVSVSVHRWGNATNGSSTNTRIIQ